MPEFVRPRHDPSASRADLSEEDRQPTREGVFDRGADFLFVGKPSRNKAFYDAVPDRRIGSAGATTRGRSRNGA